MENLLFLPVPRVPMSAELGRVPDPDELDALLPGAGAFARRAADLYREASEAVWEVEQSRPGGAEWAQAMEADRQAVLDGKPPKRWAAEVMLSGDNARWARASALARTVAGRVAAARAEADGKGIAKAATAKAAELAPKLTERSEAAYRLAVAGKKGPAWSALEEAQALGDQITRLRGVAAWADGRDQVFDPTGWGAAMDPRTRGFYISAERRLTNAPPMVHYPQNVEWPSDEDNPAVVVGLRGSSLREKGYASEDMSGKPTGGVVIQ